MDLIGWGLPFRWCMAEVLSPQQIFIFRFESGSDGLGIASHPVLSSFSSKFSIKSALNWLDLVLAALECNLWVFDGELLSPRQLLMGTNFVIIKLFVLRFEFCIPQSHQVVVGPALCTSARGKF